MYIIYFSYYILLKRFGIYDFYDHDSFDGMYLCFAKTGSKTFGKATSSIVLVIIHVVLTLRDILRPAKWVSIIVVLHK